jgi:hypothetical protein
MGRVAGTARLNPHALCSEHDSHGTTDSDSLSALIELVAFNNLEDLYLWLVAHDKLSSVPVLPLLLALNLAKRQQRACANSMRNRIR